jgi:glycosyltransferase involved in cell wall biosynthesis
MNAGGAERVAASLVNAWVKEGHEVCLMPTFSRGTGQSFYPLDPGVRQVWVARYLSGPGMFRTLAKPLILRRLIQDEAPDVIVSFLTNVNVMVLAATKGLGIPVIVCERTNPAASKNISNVLARARRLLYPQADAVMLQTQQAAEVFARVVPGLQHVAVIPNPLPPALESAARAVDDTGRVSYVSESAGMASDEDTASAATSSVRQAQAGARKQLCAMGRFVATKRFEMLIDVFARLAPQVPDWDLTIWGEGPLLSLLQEKVRKLGLQDRIHLPGKTDQPWEAISRADAFVMTSEVEGFPNVLLESMALGLPCVTMDCPSGPAELSRDGRDAILVGLSDVDALQEALHQVMTDEILRRELGHRATISVRDRYSLAAVLEQWQFLFDAVLGKSRVKPATPTESQ